MKESERKTKIRLNVDNRDSLTSKDALPKTKKSNIIIVIITTVIMIDITNIIIPANY